MPAKRNSRSLRIGLCGVGTVGGGLASLLERNAELIAERAGRPIELTRVGDCRGAQVFFSQPERKRHPKIVPDILELARDEDVDVVVELIGGTEEALELSLAALKAKKTLVTANKALLATHGKKIVEHARAAGKGVFFEAAVAGGVPVVKMLREGLAANRVSKLFGILNGTSHFVLCAMGDKNSNFDQALKLAQKLGYAEADPTLDINGEDAAQKLYLLANLAFNLPLDGNLPFYESIESVSLHDIAAARRFGYEIKPVAIAEAEDDEVLLRVHPALVPVKSSLARVDGVENVLSVSGDAMGELVFSGPGAGALPTASAVLADLIDIARGSPAPWPYDAKEGGRSLHRRSIDELSAARYMRFMVSDIAGGLSKLTSCLAENQLNIEHIWDEQRSHRDKAQVCVIIKEVKEHQVNKALETLQKNVVGTRLRCYLRVESEAL